MSDGLRLSIVIAIISRDALSFRFLTRNEMKSICDERFTGDQARSADGVGHRLKNGLK